MFATLITVLTAFIQTDGATISCDLSSDEAFDPRRGPHTAFTVTCSAGDTAVQLAADAVIARMDFELPRLNRYYSYSVSDQLVMVAEDGGWSAAPGQILIHVQPAFPMRAAEYGSTHMLCAVEVRPTLTGALEDPNVECVADVDRVSRHMVRAMEHALQGWRLAPTDFSYCMDEQLYVPAAIIVRDGSPHVPNPMPDPALLPAMCQG